MRARSASEATSAPSAREPPSLRNTRSITGWGSGEAIFCSSLAGHMPTILGANCQPKNKGEGHGESLRKKLHAHAGPVPGLHPPLHAPAPPPARRNRHAGILSRQPAIG